MSKKLYSKNKYREPKECEVCGDLYDWVSLLTAKVSLVDRELLHGKKYIHVCPECYMCLRDHKYMQGDLSLVSTYRRKEAYHGSFNRR